MSEFAVRPDVRVFLEAMKAQPRPPMNDAVVAMIRQIPPGTMPSPDLPVGEIAHVRDLAMPGPGGEIPLRLYDARETRGPGPVVVFYHGGGFVVGSIDTHGSMAASLARGLDLPVVFVDYRLAPEHPWPAAPDDAEAAARWIAANGAALGREATSLVICGDSAGGELTLVTGLALRDAPAAVPVDLLFAIYPAADRGGGHASSERFSEGLGLDRADTRYFEQAYASDRSHWRGAPLKGDPAGLAPLLLVTAEFDPLRDEGRAFAAKAIGAGVDVLYREAKGMIHGFATYRAGIPSARVEFGALIGDARRMLER
ncbi:MAG: alpha/beta hydrolase [Sphingomonadales bacterium]|nr:alpha/beta hydrolase [Sphingomonadales bacterium]